MNKPAAFAAALFFLLPAPAAAQEEPEAVYGKYHQALRAGDLEAAKKYATAAGRKQIKSILPQSYDVWNKDPGAGGKSVTLRATGKATNLPGEKPQTVSGVILLLKEGNSWKVEKADWQGANQPGLPPPESAKAPAIAPMAPKRAPNIQPAPAVAPPHTAPEPVLGKAKEPCVYKPVMTSEDMERCR